MMGIMQSADILSSNHELLKYTGIFDNPGVLAGYIIIPLFVGLYIVRTTDGKLLRLFFAYLVSMLFLTQSRASWIAFICGGIWLIISSPTFKKYRTKRFVLPILSGILLIITTTLVYTYNINADSADGRVLIWNVALEEFTRSPYIEHGISFFQSDYMVLQSSWFAPPITLYEIGRE